MKKLFNYLLVLTLILSTLTPIYADSNKEVCTKSSQKVSLNGKNVNLPAYLINNSNYIKLRDYAAILSETSGKFSIGYNEEKKVVLINKNEKYEKGETDLKEIENDEAEALISKMNVIIDGQEKQVESALINGNNYLKIRSLSELLGIKIDYNNSTKTVAIATDEKAATEDVYNCGGKCKCKHKSVEECKKCPCCKDKPVYKNGKLMEEQTEDVYNCGGKCKCKHKSVEECKKCPCCKGKDVYKNGELFEKADAKPNEENAKEDNYNCGCGCKHKTIDECKKCPCCKDKPVYKNDKLMEEQTEDVYNCGGKCKCKHKSVEECKKCPCCKGKDIYKNGELFEKADAKPNEENTKEDNYNCGCGCKHKTIDECKKCPCCKDKPVYKNGKLMEEAK